MRIGSLSVREVLLTSFSAVLIGTAVALIGDQGRVVLVLAALGAVLAALWLARGLRIEVADEVRSEAELPWLIRATYVVGVGTGGLLVLRPGDALTISDLLFLVSFALCVVYLLRADLPVRSISPWIGAGVAIFAIGALVSSAGAPQVGESLGILARFAFVAWAWVWLSVQVINDWSMVRLTMAAWATTGALTAIGAAMQAAFGDVIPGTAIAWGRMTGFTQNVNDLGGVCAIALPISISLVSDALRSHRRGAGTYFALGLLNIAGLILSGSVGGFLAAIVGLGVFALIIRRSAGLLVTAIGGSILATILFFAFGIGSSILQRYGIVTGSAGDPTATLWTRLETISAAWQVLRDQPLIGVGLAPGGAATTTGFAVHNVLLAAWYQAGILGLIGIALLLAIAIADAIRKLVRVSRSHMHRDLLSGVVGAAVSAMTLGLGGPVLYQRYFWLPIAILAAVRTVNPAVVPRIGPRVAGRAAGHRVLPPAPARTVRSSGNE